MPDEVLLAVLRKLGDTITLEEGSRNDLLAVSQVCSNARSADVDSGRPRDEVTPAPPGQAQHTPERMRSPTSA
jgi:hypothetical protein